MSSEAIQLSLLIANRFGKDNLLRTKILLRNPVMLGVFGTVFNNTIEAYLEKKGVIIKIIDDIRVTFRTAEGNRDFTFPMDIYGRNYRLVLDAVVSVVSKQQQLNSFYKHYSSVAVQRWYEKKKYAGILNKIWENQILRDCEQLGIAFSGDLEDAYEMVCDKINHSDFVYTPPLVKTTLKEWSKEKVDALISVTELEEDYLGLITQDWEVTKVSDGEYRVVKCGSGDPYALDLSVFEGVVLGENEEIPNASSLGDRIDIMFTKPSAQRSGKMVGLSRKQEEELSPHRVLSKTEVYTADELGEVYVKRFTQMGLDPDGVLEFLERRRGVIQRQNRERYVLRQTN